MDAEPKSLPLRSSKPLWGLLGQEPHVPAAARCPDPRRTAVSQLLTGCWSSLMATTPAFLFIFEELQPTQPSPGCSLCLEDFPSSLCFSLFPPQVFYILFSFHLQRNQSRRLLEPSWHSHIPRERSGEASTSFKSWLFFPPLFICFGSLSLL